MDFQQAESRFNALRDQLRDGTISRAEFVRAVGQIMVYDAYGRYWTLDPRTGHWLYFDGQTWEEAPGQSQTPTVQAAAPAGTRPPPYAQVEEAGGPNWLLLGGAGLAVLFLCLLTAIVAALITGICTSAGAPSGGGPVVQVQAPAPGAQVPVGQPLGIQSTATDAQGVTRLELWIDGKLADVTSSPSDSGQPVLTATQRWTFSQPGAHTIQVRARNRANAEGASPIITVTAIGEPAPTATPTSLAPLPSPSPPCTNNSQFISDVTIPDGTRVQPGVQLDKVWRLRNSGSCAWGAGYRWVYVDGEPLGAPDFVLVPATAPGQEADLRVVFTAPAAPGSYISRWQLQAPDGVRFGVVATLNIVVQPPPPTATATPVISPTPAPIINFWVEKDSIIKGQCTNLHWDVEYVREVWLKEGNDPEYPEVGHKVKIICPTITTEYVLRVVKVNGENEYCKVTVKVTP